MELDLSPHLTRDKNEGLFRASHKGMAHFAGTGPSTDLTCRQCKHWREGGVSHQYYSSGGKHGATLKAHPCMKFQSLTGSRGPAVPHKACACKYFDESEKAPPIFDPRVK